MPYDLQITLTLTNPGYEVYKSTLDIPGHESQESCQNARDAVLDFLVRKSAYNGPIFCFLVPANTRKLSSLVISICVPTTSRLIESTHGVFFKIILFIPALLCDLVSIPIRLVITAIPRAIQQHLVQDHCAKESQWSYRENAIEWQIEDADSEAANNDNVQPHLQRGVLNIEGRIQQFGSEIENRQFTTVFLGY